MRLQDKSLMRLQDADKRYGGIGKDTLAPRQDSFWFRLGLLSVSF
jgi:hypothetical protein